MLIGYVYTLFILSSYYLYLLFIVVHTSCSYAMSLHHIGVGAIADENLETDPTHEAKPGEVPQVNQGMLLSISLFSKHIKVLVWLVNIWISNDPRGLTMGKPLGIGRVHGSGGHGTTGLTGGSL